MNRQARNGKRRCVVGIPALSDELSQYLRHKRSLVEAHLEAALRPSPGCPPALLDAMRYSLLAPGKRLRPLLVLLAAEAGGGADAVALPAAGAVEMIHAYSLIHDDLPAMDDDDLRRGQPTCHKKFGEALAILAGDALLTLAFQVLAEGYPPATAAACCRELARRAGACGMVGGQVDDLAFSAIGQQPKADSRKPIAVDDLEALDAYGRCFGLAFQITDDLLDVEGSADQTGKGVQKDAARGKLTYPGLLGVAESRDRAERLCREAQEHVAGLGDGGRRLAALAQMVCSRDR